MRGEGGVSQLEEICGFYFLGHCHLQCKYPNIKHCRFAKREGVFDVCTATEDDFIEICGRCEKPMDECECKMWVLGGLKENKWGMK